MANFIPKQLYEISHSSLIKIDHSRFNFMTNIFSSGSASTSFYKNDDKESVLLARVEFTSSDTCSVIRKKNLDFADEVRKAMEVNHD